MQIYSSQTHKKAEFEPIEPGKVRMYVCGPTVYDNIHIGNARTFISFDVIRRWLIAGGYEVTFAQNLTDVDDKIINRANEQGRTAAEVATEFSNKFIDVMRRANVIDPDVRPRATKEIGPMIAMIKTLIEQGHAYAVENGDVYFSVRSDETYGEVSGRNIDDLMVGARIEENEIKRDPLDFALWKAAKPGEPSWKSPWGEGRPGWHTECAAMVHRYLGTPIDIHGGGSDLAFPHHENEIAQSEALEGHKTVNYWLHGEFMLVDGGKMSKSKGDFLTVSLLESKGYDPLAYRMFCLQSHYRKPLVFSYDNLDNVESAYEKLVKKIATFKDEGEMEQEAFEAFRKKFADAIRDDLNTSMALTIVYDVVKADISEKTKLALLNDFDQVLALNLTTAGQERLDAGTSVDAELEQFINEKIAERAGAKKAKDFARADAIRDELLARGITIKDTREGVVWERNA